ncbi:MAG: hypothetical protein ACJ72T_06890, partial [Nitrososphaeraceae archaeon]
DIASILKTLSNGHALSLFRTIAIEKKKPDTLRIELKLTPKQYYSRISALSKSNLVKKRWNALSYLFWQACLLCAADN